MNDEEEKAIFDLFDVEHVEENVHFNGDTFECPRTELMWCKKCTAFARLWQRSPLAGQVVQLDRGKMAAIVYDEGETVILFPLAITRLVRVFVYYKGTPFTFSEVPFWYIDRLWTLYYELPQIEQLRPAVALEMEKQGRTLTYTPSQWEEAVGVCFHARWCGFDDLPPNQRPHFS